MLDSRGVELNVGNDLNELANNSKAWVYTSSQEFSEVQLDQIAKYSEVFLSQWESHGNLIKGTVQVLKNRFIAIFADANNDMCGRAQDASVKFVKELQEILNVSLMDRMLIAFNQDNKIKVLNFNNLRNEISSGNISENTLFYNGLIQSKEEFMTNWEIPIKGSWI